MKFIISFIAFIVSAHAYAKQPILCEQYFETWQRSDKNPVLRDVMESEPFPYEGASDAHVFFDGRKLKAIYSGDGGQEGSAIMLAHATSWENWQLKGRLNMPKSDDGWDYNQETAFHRKSKTGQHQVYYIGYPTEEDYEAHIFMAEAASLEGEFSPSKRVLKPDMVKGADVYLFTSPSVVEHEDVLYMVAVGWDDFKNVSNVWSIGAESRDDGQTWTNARIVDVPIAMEGQLTKGPDGYFYATRSSEYKDGEAIFIARAKHPLGPYQDFKGPALKRRGAPREVDGLTAPQLTFSPLSGWPYLYYLASDHKKGWWTMLAKSTPNELFSPSGCYAP